MKLSLLALFVAFAGGYALADIPTPTLDQLQITGHEAAELAQTIPGDYQAPAGTSPNAPIRVEKKTLLTTKKLTRIVCSRMLMTDRMGNTVVKNETCTIQKSGNGVPLQ